MKLLIGKKLGMSQIFKDDGTVVPVTVIEAEPNVVTQIRTAEKDGYQAAQIAGGKSKKVAKPQKGHFKDLISPAVVKELRGATELNVGDKVSVSDFAEGDIVKVTGLSKGKGFAGGMKRHGFSGMPASHGHHHVARHGGSIGQRFPQHTLKGMRMPGRTGGVKRTTRGLTVVKVDAENNLIAVKGAVPGNNGGWVIVQTQ